MSIKKHCLKRGVLVVSVALLTIQPLDVHSASDSERLEKLERAVEQLQKRNAELEAEVRSLKKETAAVSEGKFKTKVKYDGKTYVEQAVPAPEKPPLFVQQRGPELKLVLGGFIQINFEDSDAFAFNGNFGQSAIKDRFRLRRLAVPLPGGHEGDARELERMKHASFLLVTYDFGYRPKGVSLRARTHLSRRYMLIGPDDERDLSISC